MRPSNEDDNFQIKHKNDKSDLTEINDDIPAPRVTSGTAANRSSSSSIGSKKELLPSLRTQTAKQQRETTPQLNSQTKTEKSPDNSLSSSPVAPVSRITSNETAKGTQRKSGDADSDFDSWFEDKQQSR
jgi:hypothetical protein